MAVYDCRARFAFFFPAPIRFIVKGLEFRRDFAYKSPTANWAICMSKNIDTSAQNVQSFAPYFPTLR